MGMRETVAEWVPEEKIVIPIEQIQKIRLGPPPDQAMPFRPFAPTLTLPITASISGRSL